jgi:acetylornithine deacetylase
MPDVLDHLRELVRHDTQNPPRRFDGDLPLFGYLTAQLDGFEVTLRDEGDGCVSWLAVRGRPTTLINVHLDTVPSSERWQHDPFTLRVDAHRAYGLGACDIKGGAACALQAARQTQAPIALLFTTDEEFGESRCVHRFLADVPEVLADVDLVVVSEPTGGRAVLAHRGYARAEAAFATRAGHSADPRGLEDNANHQLARWLSAAVAHARGREGEGALGLTGLRFNCGVIEGGTADNVIADRARAVFSLRPPPGVDPEATASTLAALEGATGAVPFVGPPLPTGEDAQARAQAAEDRARAAGLVIANPVDFWTEAALFSAAGYTTFVCGPGDIAQAHTADEWVALDQLATAERFFERLINGGQGAAS